MNIIKLNVANPRHHARKNVLNEVLTCVSRFIKTQKIARIDRQYAALGRDLDAYLEALNELQSNAERNRVDLMLRRASLRAELVKLEN